MSTQREMIVQWLMELNQQWGVDCLKLDSNHQCHLHIGKTDLSFGLSDNEQDVLLWSPLMPADKFLEDQELLTKLLVLNYDEPALSGSALSLDSERRFIVLGYRMITHGKDAQKFGDLLCNFTNTVEAVEALLAGILARHSSYKSGAREPIAYETLHALHIMRP